MIEVVQVRTQLLTKDSFAPFDEVLSREPDVAEIGTRDMEELLLNILTYGYHGLRWDHLNAHHRATQALFPMGRPAPLVVAPAGTVFDGPESVDEIAYVERDLGMVVEVIL